MAHGDSMEALNCSRLRGDKLTRISHLGTGHLDYIKDLETGNDVLLAESQFKPKLAQSHLYHTRLKQIESQLIYERVTLCLG